MRESSAGALLLFTAVAAVKAHVNYIRVQCQPSACTRFLYTAEDTTTAAAAAARDGRLPRMCKCAVMH